MCVCVLVKSRKFVNEFVAVCVVVPRIYYFWSL